MALALRQVDYERTPRQRWRVLIAVPPGGLGTQLALMRAWLNASCGPDCWGSAPAGTGGIVNDALAFYFTDEAAARAFILRFGCGYRADWNRAL